MSEGQDNPFDPKLIDFQLGNLSPDERAELMQRIAANDELSAQHEELTSVFAALDSVRQLPPMPADLVQRSVASVRQAPQPCVARAHETEQDTEATNVLFPLFARVNSIRDVLAVAATIVLLVGIGVPSILRMRERSQRAACTANLARLGQGLAVYAAAFNDSLPFAYWGSNTSWQSTADGAVRRVPNRAHMYRLLRYGSVSDPSSFICPSRSDAPMTLEQVRNNDDFIESRNVSYGYQNMAGVRPTLNDHPDLPIMADDNPLFDDGLPLGLSYGHNANSRSHGGAGQNVLTLGGRVRWKTDPNCGVDGDNIWTLLNVKIYTGREGPKSSSDSHLLK